MSRPEDESAPTDEDALWRDIVAGYGERPDFPEPEPEILAPSPQLHTGPAFDEPRELDEASWEDEGHFVPPVPPPVPRPQGIRAVAWFGLFGMPALMLVLLITQFSPPSPVGLLMIAWFVAGFGYLVATMNRGEDPDRGWDNGAVL